MRAPLPWLSPIFLLVLCASLSAAPAQPVTAHKAARAVRSECVLSAGFCVIVPASWQRLGNVFDGLGFVVAEPHPGVDSANWPQLTVAAFAPDQGKGGAAPTLDSLLDQVLAPNASSASAQTLQRSRLLIHGDDAEIVRVQLPDQGGNAGAIESVALIAGDDGVFYSIALHCAPQDYPRLAPLFQRTARSWRIQPPADAPFSHPRQDSGKR
jgi:hypothetical protein